MLTSRATSLAPATSALISWPIITILHFGHRRTEFFFYLFRQQHTHVFQLIAFPLAATVTSEIPLLCPTIYPNHAWMLIA